MNFDPKNINWKVVAAVLAALGYVAYRNKGFKNIQKALMKNGTVAAVLAVVVYFGYDFVMDMVKKQGGQPLEGYREDLPPLAHYDPVDQRHGLDVPDSRTQVVQPYKPGMAGYSKQQHPIGVAGTNWPHQSMGC